VSGGRRTIDRLKLAAVFEAAMELGVPDQVVWDTARAVAAKAPAGAPVADWLGELVDALAARIAHPV
jgi:hypothetical protein